MKLRQTTRFTLGATLALVALGTGAWFMPSADASGPEGKPVVEAVSARRVTETSAQMEATINPNGSATKYVFWVMYDPCQHGAGECALKPLTERLGGGRLAAGPAGVTVHRRLGKLQHGCLYQFWVVAKNRQGETESSRANVETTGREGLTCLR